MLPRSQSHSWDRPIRSCIIDRKSADFEPTPSQIDAKTARIATNPLSTISIYELNPELSFWFPGMGLEPIALPTATTTPARLRNSPRYGGYPAQRPGDTLWSVVVSEGCIDSGGKVMPPFRFPPKVQSGCGISAGRPAYSAVLRQSDLVFETTGMAAGRTNGARVLGKTL